MFRKRRLGDKLKVITVKTKPVENSCYQLRSRMKSSMVEAHDDSNSSEEIRNLVE